MLYKIRQKKEKFELFFQKKNGFKFKKRFLKQQDAEDFAKEYLCRCCLTCKQKEWVYRVRFVPSARSSMKGGAAHLPPTDSIAVCPECRSRYFVKYQSDDWPRIINLEEVR